MRGTAVRRGGNKKRPVQPQPPQKPGNVVQHEALELKSQNRLPSGQLLEIGESEKPLVYQISVRRNVLDVEPRVWKLGRNMMLSDESGIHSIRNSPFTLLLPLLLLERLFRNDAD